MADPARYRLQLLLDLGVRNSDEIYADRRPPMQNLIKLDLELTREMVDAMGVNEASVGIAGRMVQQLVHDLPALQQQIGPQVARHVKRALAGEHRIIIPSIDFGGGRR